MDIKLRAFLGSSSEANKVAKKLATAMRDTFYPELWNMGIFSLSRTTIEILETKLCEYDIAVFVLTPDDIAIIRDKEAFVPRDNLIFEIGLAFGILGRKNTFLVVPRHSDLKLPSDLLGIIYAEYDSDAPNIVAEMACVVNLIESSIIPLNQRSSLLRDISKTMNNMNYQFNQEYYLVAERVYKKVLDKKVVRRNWTINLKYNFDKIDKNIIIEKIIWDYELYNISNDSIEYPITLFYLDNSDINNLILYTKTEQNNRNIIFSTENDNDIDLIGSFIKRQKTISLKSNFPYYITMEFDFNHPVSPEKHYIHNCFAPIDSTIGFRLTVDLPTGYSFGLLCDNTDGTKPLILENTKQGKKLDFRASEPLLPEQVIEYILEKEG